MTAPFPLTSQSVSYRRPQGPHLPQPHRRPSSPYCIVKKSSTTPLNPQGNLQKRNQVFPPSLPFPLTRHRWKNTLQLMCIGNAGHQCRTSSRAHTPPCQKRGGETAGRRNEEHGRKKKTRPQQILGIRYIVSTNGSSNLRTDTTVIYNTALGHGVTITSP